MSAFWKVLAMGATAVAAVVVAKEVIERNEKGEDCSPMEVIKGIGRKIGVMCGCKDCGCDCDDFDDDFFDDFEEFELDDDDLFDTIDMEGDDLTTDGYVVEFNAETEIEAETDVKEAAEEASEKSVAETESPAEETEVPSEETDKKSSK